MLYFSLFHLEPISGVANVAALCSRGSVLFHSSACLLSLVLFIFLLLLQLVLVQLILAVVLPTFPVLCH